MHRSLLRVDVYSCVSSFTGIAVRTGSPLSLTLAESVWKQLVGLELTTTDITEVDKDFLPGDDHYICDNH